MRNLNVQTKIFKIRGKMLKVFTDYTFDIITFRERRGS